MDQIAMLFKLNINAADKERLIKDLIEMIPFGKDDAIKRRDLSKQLGMSDRKMRLLIHEARIKHPICSTTRKNGGYFFPTTKEEALEFVDQQYSYIANTYSTIPSVKRWIENKGQRRMEI